MLQLAMIFGMVLSVCWIVSTKEQRAAARERLKPYTRIAWVAAALAWLFILWPWHHGR